MIIVKNHKDAITRHLKSALLVSTLACVTHCYSFDWELYFKNNPELTSEITYNWGGALHDYFSKGIQLGRKSILDLPPQSNFDWEYYVENNHLAYTNETSAMRHYQEEGFLCKMPYCRAYTLVVMLHLYDLNLLDECIDELNNFMRINHENIYYIKVNIPVSDNISIFFGNASNYKKLSGVCKRKNHSCIVCNDFNLINEQNSGYLKVLVDYLNESLHIEPSRLEIIFSPNRGRDIGGFFISLDRLFKQNISYDYIVKIHSKRTPRILPLWRQLNMSFLNIHINPILRKYGCIYSNRIRFSFDKASSKTKSYQPTNVKNIVSFLTIFRFIYLQHTRYQNNKKSLKTKEDLSINGKNIMDLLNYFGLPQKDFYFCGGTMFIVSREMTEFFRTYNLIDLFYSLNDETTFNHATDGKIEHAYERFFGYLTDHLGLKTFLLDYHPMPFPDDNSVTRDYHVSMDYDQTYIKDLIDKNNIKIIALYTPVYYHKASSSAHDQDCWTSVKNSKKSRKQPHIDIGYYNILDARTRKKQAYIARTHGVEAFCYQHFWDHGRDAHAQMLEKICQDGEPNMPFALCWMNADQEQSATGEFNNISTEDSDDKQKHYAYLSKFFKHPLYIQHRNCPVLYVQRVDPECHKKLAYFHTCAQSEGFSGLHIVSLCTCTPVSGDSSTSCHNTFCPVHTPKTTPQIEQANAYSMAQNSQCLFYGLNNAHGQPLLKHKSYRLFEQFLQRIVHKVAIHGDTEYTYIFLLSWNDWHMQSMFEPNDHDEYELLNIIKGYFALEDRNLLPEPIHTQTRLKLNAAAGHA